MRMIHYLTAIAILSYAGASHANDVDPVCLKAAERVVEIEIEFGDYTDEERAFQREHQDRIVQDRANSYALINMCSHYLMIDKALLREAVQLHSRSKQ